MSSVWKNEGKRYAALEGNIQRETVVIGGGIAGFLTAYKLAEAGKKVTLLEADRLFSGTTGHTTAKITCNQGDVYFDLYSRYGKRVTEAYYKSQLHGMRCFYNLIKKFGIDCDFEETDSYIYSCGKFKTLEKTFSAMQKIGAECEFVNDLPPFGATAAIKVKGQYLFNPIKFLRALPVNFEIFEKTRVIDIDVNSKNITCGGGAVKAENIIVATHFPIINSRGFYYFKLRKSTSYTIAIKEKPLAGMYLNETDNGLSVRPYLNGTLLGGGDHRTGRGREVRHFEALEGEARRLFGAQEVTHRWSAEDVMTFDGMPMAGKYFKNADGIFVVTGFNKWGMANAMVCAEIVRDAVLEKANGYAEIFSPQRHINGAFGDFVSNAVTNIKDIMQGYIRVNFKTAKSVSKGCGDVVRYKGKSRAVYRDEEDKLHVIGRMCPHMHGELKWNADEKTWDCPCHGSRFDVDGNIVAEPATKKCKRL